MSRFRGTSISALLTVAVLALGACGGDDEGSQDSANTGPETAATTGTTETGTTNDGASETGTTERERTDRTETRERKRKRSGGSDDSSGSGGGGNSGSGGGGNSGSNAEKQLTGKNVHSTSKTVCSQFLPTAAREGPAGRRQVGRGNREGILSRLSRRRAQARVRRLPRRPEDARLARCFRENRVGQGWHLASGV